MTCREQINEQPGGALLGTLEITHSPAGQHSIVIRCIGNNSRQVRFRAIEWGTSGYYLLYQSYLLGDLRLGYLEPQNFQTIENGSGCPRRVSIEGDNDPSKRNFGRPGGECERHMLLDMQFSSARVHLCDLILVSTNACHLPRNISPSSRDNAKEWE